MAQAVRDARVFEQLCKQMEVKHNLCSFTKYAVRVSSIIVHGTGNEQKGLSLIMCLGFLFGQVSSRLAIALWQSPSCTFALIRVC